MNTVIAQRERSLTDARRRIDEAEALVYAWARRLEVFVSSTELRDATDITIAAELAKVCRERGREANRTLHEARRDVDRILNAMTAASRAERVAAR